MSEINIIKSFQNPVGFGDVVGDLETNRFESPLPKRHTNNYYEDEEVGLYIGVCDSINMIETASPYAFDAFISIIEGAMEIKNSKTGMIETIMAGESFAIPQGYDCQWHQHGYLRKFYVIFEPKNIPKKPIIANVVSFKENNITDDIPWQKTSDGHRKKVLYQNHNQTFTCGIWQSKGFNTSVMSFPYNEFIIIKLGNLICTDDKGIEHKISAGEALFIPQGVSCSWQTQGKITIHFAQIKPQ